MFNSHGSVHADLLLQAYVIFEELSPVRYAWTEMFLSIIFLPVCQKDVCICYIVCFLGISLVSRGQRGGDAWVDSVMQQSVPFLQRGCD